MMYKSTYNFLFIKQILYNGFYIIQKYTYDTVTHTYKIPYILCNV